MAIVGEAQIIVRAITTSVPRDIKASLQGVSGTIARAAGRGMGNSFSQGFNDSKGANMFTRITEGLRTLSPAAEQAADKFRGLVRGGFVLGPILSVLVGGLASLVASLGTVVAAVGAAVPALFSLVNIFGSLAVGAKVFGFAMKGISGAVSSATKTNTGLAKSVKDIREEFQQLQFQAEEAALSQERAGLNVEKAFENLRRTADLPPNSAARREAQLSYEEAELAYRRAKDRSADLNEEVAKGPEALAKAAASGGADPYAELTKSQKTFAQFLVKEVIPRIKELREVVAGKLLVPLIDDVRLLTNTLFPVLETKLGNIASTLEGSLSQAIEQLVRPDTIAEVEEAFDGVDEIIRLLGPGLSAALDGFLSLFNAAQPVAERFFTFINKKLIEFAIFSDTEAGKNRLAEIFTLASDVAASFGTIAGNIITGIGNLIGANFGEGGAGFALLDWFEEASASFATLGSEDPEGFAQYFNDVLTNAKAIFSSLGELFKGLFSIADNPAIGETFKQLEAGVPSLISIIEKNIEAGPALATLVTTILEIIDALTDTESINTFFKTLSGIAGVVRDFFNNEVVQKVLAVTGPIFAFTLALGTTLDTAKFFGSALNGIMQNAFGPIGTFVAKARQSFAFMTYSNSALTRSFGKFGSFMMKSPILIAIGLLVAAFLYLYNSSDSFRNFVDTTLKSTLEQLGEAFGKIMTALQPLIDVFVNELLPTLMDSLQPVLEVLIAGMGSFAVMIADILAVAVETIIPIIMKFMTVLEPIIKIFLALIELVAEFAKALMTGDWAAFGDVLMGVFQKIIQGIADLFTGVGNMLIDWYNFLIKAFFNSIGGGIADLINTFSGGTIDLKKNPPQIPKIPSIVVPKFAKGGVVGPRPGGTLAMVAEAGRPERIEPLDPQGLSQRDRAIIAQLAPSRSDGINIVVNAGPGMNERELAAAVSRQLAFEIRKGTI